MAIEGPNELLHVCRPIFILIVSLFFLNLHVLGGLGKFSSLLPHVLVNDFRTAEAAGGSSTMTCFLGYEEGV